MKSITISVLLALAGMSAQGKSLTLSEAVQSGLSNSPKVQKAKAAADEAHWKKVETYNGFLPNVSVSANHLFSKQYQFVDVNLGGGTQSIPQVIPSNSWSLNASLPLFEGFSSWNRTSAASLGEDAAQNELDWTRFQLEHEVQIRYFQALAAQKLKAVSEQNQTTLAEHLSQARALKKGGAATSYDVLRVEVQMNEAQSEVLKTEDDAFLARQRLAQTLGIDESIDQLVGDLPQPQIDKIQKLQKADLSQRKDLVALEQKAESTDKLENAAKAFWVPRVALNGSWISYNNRNDDIYDHDAYRWAYTIGLTLNWSIFDIGAIARSQQAVAQRVQVEKSTVQAKQQSVVDFEFWKRRCLYSANLYKAKLSDVEKAQESVRLAKESYRAGARTSSDVLDSELELFRARAGVVNSQMNYAESLMNLELALGHSL
jgi:outer membrane protein TolC